MPEFHIILTKTIINCFFMPCQRKIMENDKKNGVFSLKNVGNLASRNKSDKKTIISLGNLQSVSGKAVFADYWHSLVTCRIQRPFRNRKKEIADLNTSSNRIAK